MGLEAYATNDLLFLIGCVVLFALGFSSGLHR